MKLANNEDDAAPMARTAKLPRGLSVFEGGGKLVLSYRHHRATGFFLLCAGLFWTCMLPSSYRVLAGGGSFGPSELLALIPFLGMAVGFGYVGLAKLVNASVVTFDTQSVTVRHRPLPWFGETEVATSDIERYSVKRDVKPRDARHRVTLGLMAELFSGKRVALLGTIADSKAARFMHERAEAHLEEMRRGS